MFSNTPLTQTTGLENISDSYLEMLIQENSDIFGKPIRERNRRLFQQTTPIFNSLSIEMNQVWNEILSLIPFAVMSVKKNNTIQLELNEIIFELTTSIAFPSKIQIKIVFEGFSSANFVNPNEITSYLETILEDMNVVDNEPTDSEKEAYCYYQSLEIQQAMAGMNEMDLRNLRL